MRLLAGMVVWILLMAGSLWGIGIEKIHEVEYETEVVLYTMGDGCLLVTRPSSQGYGMEWFQEGKQVKSFKIPRGEGPGEVNMIKGVFQGEKFIFVWDDRLRRLNKFDKKWKFIELYKFPKIRGGLLLGQLDGSFVFKWEELGMKGGERTVTTTVGFINKKGEKSVLHKTSGRFTYNDKLDQKRSYLMADFSRDRFFVGTNQDYKLEEKKYIKKQFLEGKVISKKTKTMPWDDRFTARRREIMPRGIEEHAPDIVPPLFEIQMDEEFTAVITNESIQRDLTKIDIWEKNKYLGSVEIPILYTQNFVFPPIFNFPTGICLQGGKLYSLHYDLEKDLYRVCTWKLKF